MANLESLLERLLVPDNAVIRQVSDEFNVIINVVLKKISLAGNTRPSVHLQGPVNSTRTLRDINELT